MTIICPPPLCAHPIHPDLTVKDQWDYVPLAKPAPIAEQRWPEGTRPLVTVLCTTFNHAKYIRQAIEGFLIQETTFPVQIFVHDDASTDDTASIISEYEKLYPSLFLVVLQPVNLYSRKIIRQVNHLFFGKYIAYCEGDDFWTHPWKLQIQCRRLEDNSSSVLSYHPVLVLDSQSHPKGKEDATQAPEGDNHLEDLARRGNYIHTPSVVARNVGFERPEVFSKSPAADFCSWMQLLTYGELDFVPNSMAVYRWGVGVWSVIPDNERCVLTAKMLMVLYEYFAGVGNCSVCDIFKERIVSLASSNASPITVSDLEEWSSIGTASAFLTEALALSITPSIAPPRSEVRIRAIISTSIAKSFRLLKWPLSALARALNI